MAKEHELSSLGAQAAAAAHSLGTPLSTISLVVKELKEELKGNNKLEKEIDLLISQSDRCNQILKKLSINPHLGDEFIRF
jgi:two-component system sensor histidine kinase RegB